ncbi:MAG: DUF411 domain-containing protein [Mariprofundaceae bacterium]|nr:DUF411 domain-containing protein [Mariprofundaceae bacterium]
MLKVWVCLIMCLWSVQSFAGEGWDQAIQKDASVIEMSVQHDPNCGCCTDWIAHLERHGIKVTSIKNDDMASYKAKMVIPENMQSCHTATVGNYVIEGHVPANDIKALLKSKDKTIYGLSVPEMPVGTPGMKMGDRKDPFAVMSFDKEGHVSTYKEYNTY